MHQCRTRAAAAQMPDAEQPETTTATADLHAHAAQTLATALHSDTPKLALPVALGFATAALLLAAGTAHAGEGPLLSTPIADIAENEGFWQNVLRYIQYFFTVLLGTAYVAIKPFLELFKRPVTAVIGISAVVGLFAFVSFTVSAMLGLSDPVGYEPSSFYGNTQSLQ